MTTGEALDMAVASLRRDAETKVFAHRQTELLGEMADDNTRKDAVRYKRIIKAIGALEDLKRDWS